MYDRSVYGGMYSRTVYDRSVYGGVYGRSVYNGVRQVVQRLGTVYNGVRQVVQQVGAQVWTSAKRSTPSEAVAEGPFSGNGSGDALARARDSQRMPTGDRPTKPRRVIYPLCYSSGGLRLALYGEMLLAQAHHSISCHTTAPPPRQPTEQAGRLRPAPASPYCTEDVV